MQLNWSQMDCATYKKLISQKQSQQEALQAHYSTCLRTLRETEGTLASLTKVNRRLGLFVATPTVSVLCLYLLLFHSSFTFRKPVATRLK